MSPTRVEGTNYFRDKMVRRSDRIKGTVDADTMREVLLYTTKEQDEHRVFLDVLNLKDRARVFLDRGIDSPPLPKPLHATLNDEPVADFDAPGKYIPAEVREGQVFRIWFEGEKGQDWENRDQNLGFAEVTWTPQ